MLKYLILGLGLLLGPTFFSANDPEFALAMAAVVTTLVKTNRTIQSSVSNTAGSTTRAALDLRTTHGGLLTAKITNGGTGPTVQCVCNVMVAHDTGTTPATGAAGSVWKTIAQIGGGGTTASAVTEMYLDVPPGVMHLQVEFTGNTGQTVTVEAFFSEITSASSV